MIVSAWSNGGTGYGIRVPTADRARYFSREWKNVRVKIPGMPEVECSLSSGFWGKCSEIRSVAFRNWFEKLAHVRGMQENWEERNPPKFHLTPISGNRFSLKAR